MGSLTGALPGSGEGAPYDDGRPLEEPLLQPPEVEEGSAAQAAAGPRNCSVAAGPRNCSVAGGVANLAVTAVGAGMLALPRAFAAVGIVAGLLVFAFVWLLSYFSTSIIVKHAAALGKQSYGELVEAEFGRAGATLLQLAILTHAGGVMVVYLIIIGDVLVGSAPDWEGVLPTALGRHDGPWYLSRGVVVGALLLAVVAPMLAPRDLAAVSRFSRASVGLVLALVAIISGLAAAAVSQGKAADVDLLPQFQSMGAGTPLDVATCLLTVVSIGCLAFTCQFNLLPIQNSLKDGRRAAMLRVIRCGLSLCAVLYALVAVSGYLLFGAATEGDVLKGLTVKFVSGLVPPRVAHGLIDSVALCYCFNLLVNFVLKVWPVRDNVAELALGRPALSLGAPALHGLSAALAAGALGLSVVVPEVWGVVSLVGSTACVVFSYLFPGALVLRREAHRGRRAAAAAMMALGFAMAGVAVYNRVSRGGGGGGGP